MYAGVDLFDLRYNQNHFRRLQRPLQLCFCPSVDCHAFYILAEHSLQGWLRHHFVARRFYTVHPHVDHRRRTTLRVWFEPCDRQSHVCAPSSVCHKHNVSARWAQSRNCFQRVSTATTATTTFDCGTNVYASTGHFIHSNGFESRVFKSHFCSSRVLSRHSWTRT